MTERDIEDDAELCPHCSVNEVEVDDFGYYGCRECMSPEIRSAVYKKQDKEDSMFGRED